MAWNISERNNRNTSRGSGLIYFISHPIQYFSPLFKVLSKEMSLEIFYYSDVSIKGNRDIGFGTEVKWDIPLLEGYQYKFVPNWRAPRPMDNQFWDVFNPGVIKELWKAPQKIVIVNGWSYSSNWLVIIFGKLFGKKIWMRSESPYNQEIKKNRKVLLVKKIILKYILFTLFIDKALFIGSQNKKFYNYYGIKDEGRFIFTPYAVDNDHFKSEYKKNKNNKDALKAELGMPVGKKIILYSGKYIKKKRPMDLLIAFHELERNHYVLVFVGDGELRGEMENYISENNMQDVFLTGFINQSEISKYYSIADLFVMCSGAGETWGLSVNEAMNFELPVIVSKTCGCCEDLVTEGVNGFGFDEGNVEMLSQKMRIILDDEKLAEKMGREGARIIQDYSITTIVNNLLKVT